MSNLNKPLAIIFLLSLAGVVGSLYFSTFGDPVANIVSGTFFPVGSGFEPCLLCWWARIFLYPIAIISGVALIKNNTNSSEYILALAIPGLLLTTYHSMLQWFPNTPTICGGAISCAIPDVMYFGFVSIPFLGFLAFLGIVILAVVQKERAR